jgi:guanylate kinase
LGYRSNKKYQYLDGATTEKVFNKILEVGTAKNKQENSGNILISFLLEYLIGFSDGHAKNHSLQLFRDGEVELAPLYDVSTMFTYPNQMKNQLGKSAFGIGGEIYLFIGKNVPLFGGVPAGRGGCAEGKQFSNESNMYNIYVVLDELLRSEISATLPDRVELKIDGVANARDWGNALNVLSKDMEVIKNQDKTKTNSLLSARKLIRTAHLSSLTPKGEEQLLNLGVEKVIDLRSITEAEQEGYDKHSKVSEGKIEYLNIPVEAIIEEDVEQDVTNISDDDFINYGFWSMKRLYSYFISDETMRKQFGKALIEISNTKGAVLIHCRSGKDRTGWLSALCGMICGLEWEAIMNEYLMSKTAGIEKAKDLANFYSQQYTVHDWRMFIPFASVFSEYLQNAYDLMIEKFGNLDNYLKSCGVDRMVQKKIQEKFIGKKNHNSGDFPDLVVLAGPTAVGKGTVSRRLVEKYPQVYLSVSATTRDPRPGEIDGVHYHFLTRSQFDQKIDENEFLEWAVVHQENKYGTLKQPIIEANKQGRPALLEIDLQGARKVRQVLANSNFKTRLVFLAPPTFEELITRLGMRGTESREERERRLETARVEMRAEDEFDDVIVNDDVDVAVHQLAQIMGLEK